MFLPGDTCNADSAVFLEQCSQPWLYTPCTAAEIRSAMQEVLRVQRLRRSHGQQEDFV
jgi:hypothetical protein